MFKRSLSIRRSAAATRSRARSVVRRFAVDLDGIDNCDGDRHLYAEAGGQKHTQWLAPVSRAASPYPSL
jgi:hypothetical protein